MFFAYICTTRRFGIKAYVLDSPAVNGWCIICNLYDLSLSEKHPPADTHITIHSRAVARSENPGVPVLFGGHNLSPLVEIGLIDLPKAGCAMAHLAHPGTTGLWSKYLPYLMLNYSQSSGKYFRPPSELELQCTKLFHIHKRKHFIMSMKFDENLSQWS
jgi:hypothetical protein